MLELKWMDVDMKNQRLYLRETKNGVLRILPIPETLNAPFVPWEEFKDRCPVLVDGD